MTTYIIPYDEPLIKAKKPPKPPKPPNLGSWKGLPIIALGKRNGKIVGYDSKGKPIYANSNQAKKLAAIKQQDDFDKTTSIGEWLLALGIPNKVQGNAVYVQPAAAELLEDHFGVSGSVVGKAVRLSWSALLPHVGSPFTPKEEDLPGWAAGMASGEIEEDPFPDLSTLKELKDPGKFAGSGYHGVNRLFEDPSGQKYVFKDKVQVTARAEEAASRIGRLILGKEKIPPVRMVEINGQPGALIKVVPGEMMTESNHGNPPGKLLDKHRKDIARHFVVDWLISNHDAHGGNFLTDGDNLVGIDKGQAWKFFGQDEPLDHNYSPNEHDPIYRKFWNAVQKGTIELATVLPALGEALDAAEKISPKQYEGIIGPYLGEVGKDLSAKLVGRLENLREQLEGYLSKLMGKPVQIPKKHADNFETMPEVEAAKEGEPPLTIKVPDKPKVIEGGPTEAIKTEQAAGWPATKGKVTINHPGEASPGGKWPKGYPGPGFSSSVTYKKQKFTVEFAAGPGGKPQVDVYYPDGNKMTWDSPNQASDSMYLYVKGMKLTLSATKKKELGISLPAKKAFGIQAFKHELAQAHAGELPVAAMNPKELEQAGVVPENAPELSAEAVIGKMPDGPVEDWDELPHEVKEAMLANDFMIGADYPAAIIPGWAYKATEEGVPVLYFPKKPTTPGAVLYQVFEWEQGKLTQDVMLSSSVDAIYNLDTNATLQALKKDIIQDLPQTADEKIGAAPKAEIPKEAVVPPEAPKHYDGPLPLGTTHTIQKKFPWGKSEVMLLAHEQGFDAAFFDPEGEMVTQTFKSLSAASDWIWVVQKGYGTAKEYKAATGKNKIPSGGGWKFWGLNTKPKPPVSNKVLKAPELVTAVAPEEPTPPEMLPGPPPIEGFKDPLAGLPTMWDDVGAMWSLDFLKTKPEGTQLKVGDVVWVKSGDGDAGWRRASGGAVWTSFNLFDVMNPKEDPIQWRIMDAKAYAGQLQPEPVPVAPTMPPAIAGYADPLEGLPTTWDTAPPLTASLMSTQPEGTQLKVDDTIWVKIGSGDKAWLNVNTGKPLFSHTLMDLVSGKSVQYRTMDVEKFKTLQDLGAPPLVAPPPIEPASTVPKFATESKELKVVEVKPTIAAMKPGDEVRWTVANIVHRLIKQPDGTYLKAVDNEVTATEVSLEEVNDVIPWHQTPEEWGFFLAADVGEAPPVMPEGPAYEDIPANVELVDKAIQNMKPGDLLTWNEAGIGYEISKKSDGTYTVRDESGDLIDHQLSAQEAIGNVAWSSGPTDFQMQAAEAPGPTAPTTSEPNWETMPEVPTQYEMDEMPSGTEFRFSSPYTDYQIKKLPSGGWNVSRFHKAADEEEEEEILNNEDAYWVVKDAAQSAEGKNQTFVLQKKTADPKPMKTVVMPKKSAVFSDLYEQWGGKTFTKPSNKKNHTNIFVTDQEGGKQALADVAEKYGLTITNTKGQPKWMYGKWLITVPDSELDGTISSEVPADGPIPETAEPSPALAEEKEEAKWAAVGAVGGKASQLEGMGYQFKWASDVLPDDNVVDPAGPTSGSVASKIKAKGLVLVKGKKPKPKPELTPEQKAKIQKAKEVGEWLKNTPAVSGKKALTALSHFQTLFDKFKPGMKAWARSAGGSSILIGSPDSEFADLMEEMKTHGLKTTLVDTPLGSFWKVSTAGLAKALPGQPADIVKGPDGKEYPKGTKWYEEEIKTTTAQMLETEPGYYKITDHKTDPKLKVLKVSGQDEEARANLVKMANKHMLTYDEVIKGGFNWLTFVPTAELEKVAKTEVIYNAEVPSQPKPFISAPYPTMGAVAGGQPGISNRSDLSSMSAIKIGRNAHSVRMGAPGMLKNGQIYVRRVKDSSGKVYYDVHGELGKSFHVGKAMLNPKTNIPIPSAMSGYKEHKFEDGVHQETGTKTYESDGYIGVTASGSSIKVFSSSGWEAFRDMFSVRIPEDADLESELANAFDAMGLDADEAMREQTPDDERILKKSAIVKNKIGPTAWIKGPNNADFPEDKRFDEVWLDKKLKTLGITQAMVESAEFRTTVLNHQSVVIDDPVIAKSDKVKFVYIGMGQTSLMNQIVDGSGWYGRTQYSMNGQKYGGASDTADLNSGGANTSFCRVAIDGHGPSHPNFNMKSWGLACEGWKVIFHKRILNRTNWRFYKEDSYGAAVKGSGHLKNAKPREGVLDDNVESSNEVCFDVGVGVTDIAGIAAPNEASKQDMIDQLTKKGVTEVNGIALNDLIQVVESSDRREAAKKFVGLKEGVLP